MEDNTLQSPMLYQKQFIGIIIASFTHEIKNHLAVIRESSGLQQDIIAMDKKVKDTGALVQFLYSVDGQVERSLKLISWLNRFAHRMDNECAEIQAYEVVDEVVSLTLRIAHQRVITVTTDYNRELAPVTIDPARLQMLIFYLLDEKIQNLDRKSSVLVAVNKDPSGILITLTPTGSRRSDSSGVVRCPRGVLEKVAAELSIELSIGEIEHDSRILVKR